MTRDHRKDLETVADLLDAALLAILTGHDAREVLEAARARVRDALEQDGPLHERLTVHRPHGKPSA